MMIISRIIESPNQVKISLRPTSPSWMMFGSCSNSSLMSKRINLTNKRCTKNKPQSSKNKLQDIKIKKQSATRKKTKEQKMETIMMMKIKISSRFSKL
jgi:hypothetical protein